MRKAGACRSRIFIMRSDSLQPQTTASCLLASAESFWATFVWPRTSAPSRPFHIQCLTIAGKPPRSCLDSDVATLSRNDVSFIFVLALVAEAWLSSALRSPSDGQPHPICVYRCAMQPILVGILTLAGASRLSFPGGRARGKVLRGTVGRPCHN